MNQTPTTSEEEEDQEEEQEEEYNQSPPTTSEEPPESEDEWNSVYNKLRNGNQLWLMTFGAGPIGGYISDYTTIPRAVFRWRRTLGEDAIITPLPDGVRLLYRTLPLYSPEAHVCEFTVEEVIS